MRELSERRINRAEEVVQVGQEIEGKILELYERDRRIILSLREAERDKDRKDYHSFSRRQRDDGRTTLGDLFGHLFADQLREAEEARVQQQQAAAPPAEAVSEAPEPEPAALEAAPEAPALAAAPELPALEAASAEPVAEHKAATGEQEAAPVAEAVTAIASEKEAVEEESPPQAEAAGPPGGAAHDAP